MRPSTTSAVLRADGITHSYGDRRVLSGLSLTVPRGQRVGLIGENGVGKSTLLRMLAGVETPDEGVVDYPMRTGLLWQEVQVGPDDTLGDIVEGAIREWRDLERELEDTAIRMAAEEPGAGPDADSAADRYAAALAAAEAAELWTLDSRRDELLDGLGVGQLPLSTRVDEVSGGQRSRVALAALLLSRPDALLLDEPTNHLDDSAAAFLATRLREWRGPLLFASHDRAFLDDVATGLIDIDPSRGGVTRYTGGYTAYLAEKAAERARWEQQHSAEEKELARLEVSVAVTARAVAPGRGPRDNDKFLYDFKAGNVAKQISRRVRNAQGRLDDLEEHRVDAPPPLLTFAGIPSGSQILDIDEPLLTATDIRIDGRLQLDGFELRPDARLLVTGPNGAGKSTLLAALAGTLQTDSGTIRRRKGLRIGMLSQDVRWLEPTRSARELWEKQLGGARAEAFPLSSLGLIAERDLDRPVGRLSIGQQRRVALALVIAKPPHVFLLDEPTNHLSLGLATELENALGSYPGAVVIASHDRWLRRRWHGDELSLSGGRALDRAA